MMNKKIIAIFFLLLGNIFTTNAQDDLMDLLGDDKEEVQYTTATFKATRIINGHTIESRRKGTLDFLISHRFGTINGGAYELFGLDEANIRFALEYGLTDRINIGVGRNSFQKTYDSFLKYKILKQSTGAKKMPISMSYFTSAALNTMRFDNTQPNYNTDQPREHYFSSRMAFTHQLLIARKFGENFSFQLMPTMVHRNLVYAQNDPNDIFALGLGARQKITKSFSINGEYYYQINPNISTKYYNSAAIAFELETGGHVFQMSFSNSRAMIEKGFITETEGNILFGDIHFGFNIFRTF